MDVREKLVELLNQKIDGGFKFSSYLYESGEQLNNEEIASHLIAHGVTVQEWISTDERMPTEDDATDGDIAVLGIGANETSKAKICSFEVVIAYPDSFDYWMPLRLIQPPKGE